ncbi:profilin, required for normal timing of actin polymerization in response to thermal stress [Podospora pseudoanserina]|uniref:Profilin n=1 Tax=Podospora pseudoanserina TaxID=2609844 RepID=A0ABR0IDC2_9PEZI|nr:profilin, required for normal timing of actin polymerization in response to thermal stress [Podospora pseudoanserina]
MSWQASSAPATSTKPPSSAPPATALGPRPRLHQITSIISILNETDKSNGPAATKAFAEGIHVGGERYVATRNEDRHVYGRQGRTGICIVKTKQAILVGHYGENAQAGNATQTVEALADYLIGLGY